MADRSRQYTQAVLVPDPRITLDSLVAASSSYTGTSPLPGQPVPDGDTGIGLTARGSQAAGDVMRVSTRRGGAIGRDGATFIWRQDGEDWHGWDAPTVLTSWEPVTWATSPTTWTPHAVEADTGDVVAVWARGSLADSVGTATRTAAVWSAAAEIDIGATLAAGACPCLCRLDDGRLLLFCWTQTEANVGQVRMLFSDDDGATWSIGSTGVLPATVDLSSASTGFLTMRLRAAALDGQILLLAWLRSRDTAPAAQDELRQYASCDGGHTFSLVYTSDRTVAADSRAYPDVAVADDSIIVAWLDTVNRLPNACRLTSAYLPLSSVDAYEVAPTSEVWGTLDGTGKYFNDGDLWLVSDETGVLICSGRLPTTGNRWVAMRSSDLAATWAPMARSSTASGGGAWWDAEDSSTYPRDACAIWYRGQAFVISAFSADPGTYDGGSLIGCLLGGYTTAPMPGYDAWRTDARQVSWGETWVPLDEPGDTGWTRTATGAATDSITSSGRLEVNAGLGTLIYSRACAGSVANGAIVGWCLTAVAGTPAAGVTITTADAGEGYQLRVALTAAGGITVSDVIGAVTIGSATGITGEVAFLASITAGVCSVWYRTIADQYSARPWVRLVDSVVLTDDAGATITTSSIAWGHGTGGVGLLSRWRWLCWIDDGGGAVNYVGTGLGGATFPADLVGRRYSLGGVGLGLDAATIIDAEGGPTYNGDAWDLTPTDTWPIDNVHAEVSPSPRDGARFDASTTTTLVWETSDANSYPAGGRSLAVALLGINFPSATIEGRSSSSGTWTSLGTISAIWLSTASFTRTGDTLRITSGTPARYVAHGALVGFYVDLGGGDVRRVAGNSEGQVGAGGPMSALLRLEGIDGTEGASGTCTLYAPQAIGIVAEPSNRYHRYRLTIAATTTAEGYVALGKVLIGSLYLLARSPSSGRSTEVAPQIEVAEQTGGVSRVRRVGPALRQVRLPLDDLLPSSQVWASSPDPGYQLLATGGTPYAAMHATAESLAGLVAQLAGAPVVYIDRVKQSASTTALVSYNDPSRLVYGRFVDPITLTVARGSEGSGGDASYTVGGLLLRELP
jgi:hypothetical protein